MSLRDPYTDPFCKPEDLGLAIPESDHAVSACLPTWQDVVGYEEGEDRVIDALECGYPRFVEHPFVAELFQAAQEEYAKNGEVALVFPTLAAAWRCADFAKRQGANDARLESYGWNSLTVLLVKEEDYAFAWKGWQHMGEIVSSRTAQAALSDAPIPGELETAGEKALKTIRERIAEQYSCANSEDVFLFSSGMGAIGAIHRVVLNLHSSEPTIQLCFPYLDALKLQQKCNSAGAIDLSIVADGGLKEVTEYIKSGRKAAALFSELPSNPLLHTANVRAIAPVLKEHGIPMILDDTVATSINVEATRYADAVTTSLTKCFSGAGDVAAGAVILNRDSPFYDKFCEALPSEEEASPLFCLDAIVLEVNSRHYEEKVRAMDKNASEVVSFIVDHPGVEIVWHPSVIQRDFYDDVKKPDGAYGSLFSIKLAGSEADSARFYDRLRVSKGPSLGTHFSLACPYTLLAHYDELDWAEDCGVPRDLIRLSIGLEEPDDLLQRFEDALE